MAWWDIFCNSASIPGDKQEEDVPEEYIEIFGPKPAISPGAKPNIHVTGAANRWEKRAKNFKGIILDFDFDTLLKQILNSLPLQGVETKERWMEISDPRNYDILEPVLYEMNDGHEFLAFLDTPNNVSLNRVPRALEANEALDPNK